MFQSISTTTSRAQSRAARLRPSSGDQFDRLIDAIKGNQTGRVEAEARDPRARDAEATAPRRTRPVPKSRSYNPRGERDHPRPPLKCPSCSSGRTRWRAQTLLSKETRVPQSAGTGQLRMSPRRTGRSCRSTVSATLSGSTGARWRRLTIVVPVRRRRSETELSALRADVASEDVVDGRRSSQTDRSIPIDTHYGTKEAGDTVQVETVRPARFTRQRRAQRPRPRRARGAARAWTRQSSNPRKAPPGTPIAFPDPDEDYPTEGDPYPPPTPEA